MDFISEIIDCLLHNQPQKTLEEVEIEEKLRIIKQSMNCWHKDFYYPIFYL